MTSSDVEQRPIEKTLQEIARLIDGRVEGDDRTVVKGACGLREALEGDITFLAHPKHLPLLKKSRASAVIVGPDVTLSEKPAIRTQNPTLAFLKILDLWKPAAKPFESGIHPDSSIAEGVHLGKNVTIGPGAVLEKGTTVGDDSVILSNSVIGESCQIGRGVLIYPNVTVRERSRIDDRVILHTGVCIGSDGFGYETVEGRHIKIPQIGNVWIAEDVEIGANSCVDRARFGTTHIGKGTKIDNLVQIAHNVKIGENCLIVSQAGVAGSAEIGDRVVLAGQVGVVGHIRVGEDSLIGAQSGVFTSVPAGSVLLGTPPRPVREEKQLIIYVSRLPELYREVKELKKKIEALQKTL